MADETQQLKQDGVNVFPKILIANDLVTDEEYKALSAKMGKQLSEEKLDVPGYAPGTTEPIRVPYFFDTQVSKDGVTVRAHSVKLVNGPKEEEIFTLEVPIATENTAGIITGSQKEKWDNIIDDVSEVGVGHAWSSKKTYDMIKEYAAEFAGNYPTHADLIAATVRPDGKPITIDDYAIVENDAHGDPVVHDGQTWRYKCVDPTKLGTEGAWAEEYKFKGVEFTQEQWDSINSTATKEKIDSIANKIDSLGVEPGSGEPYHIPFNVNPFIIGSTSIATTFDTITLDGNKTKVSYEISIPSANVGSDRAGLYNKSLADVKLDVDSVITAQEIEALWQS